MYLRFLAAVCRHYVRKFHTISKSQNEFLVHVDLHWQFETTLLITAKINLGIKKGLEVNKYMYTVLQDKPVGEGVGGSSMKQKIKED